MKHDEHDQVDSQSLALVGIFGAAVVFVVILGVQVLYYRMERSDDEKKFVEPGSTDLHSMVEDQSGMLTRYKWVDRDKGIVTIPIERAMDVVVHDLQRQHQ